MVLGASGVLWFLARRAPLAEAAMASCGDLTRHPALTRQIEVERKISLANDKAVKDFEARLAASGAERVKSTRFTDVYYDTAELALTAANHYLRLRDGRWELKVPSAGDSLTTSVFEELTTEEDIACYFADSFPDPPTLPFGSVPRTVPRSEGGTMGVLMRFETCRSTWRLGTMSVDVDRASTGVCLAEFEMLCESETQVPRALEDIDTVCRKMGLHEEDPSSTPSSPLYAREQPPGKFERYILDREDLLARVLRHAPHIISRFLPPPAVPDSA
uniref:CYTH domain-containing protein n=1 Tax=Rhizochromulina marina TaxID=1034831 RepID=A0A7S2WMM1_9STRA|mmetsp:Transcript_27882/g.81630  ORF Transcript_27882/g.81630 Transcript_27882/m.81630 type:complete len:274 (+) Transcript_27882:61-882(+)